MINLHLTGTGSKSTHFFFFLKYFSFFLLEDLEKQKKLWSSINKFLTRPSSLPFIKPVRTLTDIAIYYVFFVLAIFLQEQRKKVKINLLQIFYRDIPANSYKYFPNTIFEMNLTKNQIKSH